MVGKVKASVSSEIYKNSNSNFFLVSDETDI
jgi:hypothetical protein